MDVGFYLSELLMQQNEVSIPRLGSFERLRMSGYYDENERTFYPPYHRAKFSAGSPDADPLADYIALKKNISGASAGYFVEKYVSNIKQEALTGEVAIGNLGWFYTADDQLTFKPADKISNDSIFYGLEPVGIAKAAHTTIEEIPSIAVEEVIEEPEIIEEAIAEIPYQPEHETVTGPVVFENHYQEQPVEFYNRQEETSTAFNYVNVDTTDERKSPLRIFLIVVVVILLLDTVVLGIYRYDPDTFARIAFWKDNTKPADTVRPKAAVIKVADTANTDSIATADGAQKKADTVAKAAPVSKKKKAEKVTARKTEQPVVKQPVTAAKPAAATTKAIVSVDTSAVKPSDAVGTRRFEVYALTCKTMPTALRYSLRLRKNGLDPRIVTDAPGKLIHVSVGHFATEKEARAYAIKLAEAGKVSTDIYPREIIPQKNKL